MQPYHLQICNFGPVTPLSATCSKTYGPCFSIFLENQYILIFSSTVLPWESRWPKTIMKTSCVYVRGVFPDFIQHCLQRNSFALYTVTVSFLGILFLLCVSFGGHRGMELACAHPDSHAASSPVFTDRKKHSLQNSHPVGASSCCRGLLTLGRGWGWA